MKPRELSSGTILATRNVEEIGNNSPGHWNHIAVVSVNGWVVEGQREPRKVIAVPLKNFLERYPEILAFHTLRVPDRSKLGKKVQDYVGMPYRRIRNNCVTVARRGIEHTTGRRPRWRIPDDVVEHAKVIVWGKRDYDNWEPPEEWFAGMVTKPTELSRRV